MPADFMSSGCIVTVLTVARYSAESLPMLICWPCFVVRPAFMMKRCDSTLLHPRGIGDWGLWIRVIGDVFTNPRIHQFPLQEAEIITWRSAPHRRGQRGGRAQR